MQTNLSYPKSTTLTKTGNSDSNKYSGLPPSLASKLAALNANKEKEKKKELIVNDDEVEDISQKYNNSATIKGSQFSSAEKNTPIADEIYSRFKIGGGSETKNPTVNKETDLKEKGKNEAL